MLALVPTDELDVRVAADIDLLNEVLNIIHRAAGHPDAMAASVWRGADQVGIRIVPPVRTGPSIDEQESLGLGRYLARGLIAATGGALTQDNDRLGRPGWSISFSPLGDL